MVATRDEHDLLDPFDEHDDLTLLAHARAGDTSAADQLWVRTWPSALAVARYVADNPSDAEDLASEAMTGVFAAIARGAGPTSSVRAYVGTSIRNLHTTALRRQARVGRPVELDDDRVLELVSEDPDVIESDLVARAFRGLPTRWQFVLWATLVEGRSGAEVAEDLGSGAAAVHALKARALEGLRLQYLTEHARRGQEKECRAVHRTLAATVRSRKQRAGEAQQVWKHLRGCSHCAEAHRELTAINTRLGALVGPGVVGVVGLGSGHAGLGLLEALRWEGLRAITTSAASWGTAAVVAGAVAVSTTAMVQHDPGNVAPPPRTVVSPAGAHQQEHPGPAAPVPTPPGVEHAARTGPTPAPATPTPAVTLPAGIDALKLPTTLADLPAVLPTLPQVPLVLPSLVPALPVTPLVALPTASLQDLTAR